MLSIGILGFIVWSLIVGTVMLQNFTQTQCHMLERFVIYLYAIHLMLIKQAPIHPKGEWGRISPRGLVHGGKHSTIFRKRILFAIPNQQEYPSETSCTGTFNFSSFYENSQFIDPNWLEWFIGKILLFFLAILLFNMLGFSYSYCESTDLVVWGSKISSTVGYRKFPKLLTRRGYDCINTIY